MGVVEGRGSNAIEYPLPWRRSTDPEQAILCLPSCRVRAPRRTSRVSVPYSVPAVFIYIYARDSPFLVLPSLSLCVYLRVEIHALCIYVYVYIYVYIDGRMAWVERDGNASDEIRGTRVPRVTQGQLDSRPFKRDYVQRPSSLAPSLSISGFSLFSRARGEQRSVFPILPGFRWMDSVLFLLLRAVVFDGIFFFFLERG